MHPTIRRYAVADREAVVQLSLAAWAPVFASIEAAMSRTVFAHFYPDWPVQQQQAVETVCQSEDNRAWIAEINGQVVGFVVTTLHQSSTMGEIVMLAVAPSAQKQGIGSALTAFALKQLRDAGMHVAMVETGGDPGHAPARRTYEQQGFQLLPVARYFRTLDTDV